MGLVEPACTESAFNVYTPDSVLSDALEVGDEVFADRPVGVVERGPVIEVSGRGVVVDQVGMSAGPARIVEVGIAAANRVAPVRPLCQMP